MLAKKFRLPIGKWNKERNKKTVVRKGVFFIVKSAPNNLEFSRFGVAVGSKTVKTAVGRNRFKRLIFNFIRLNGYCRPAGKDALIIVQSAANKSKKPEMEKELKTLLT